VLAGLVLVFLGVRILVFLVVRILVFLAMWDESWHA
jgi:hypothetical protein